MKTVTRSSSSGFILLMVLVVIMLTSMVAASLLFVLSAEHTAAAAGNSGEQARAAAMSGVYQAMRVASDATPGSLDWQDNPSLFRDQLVCEDGTRKWYFSVYSLTGSESSPISYGLTDEAGKINVYRAVEATLEALPNMTPPIAQNLLSAAGASQAAVAMTPGASNSTVIEIAADPAPDASQTPAVIDSSSVISSTVPTSPALWSSVDELLQVSGFNVQLLYGNYSNYSGRVDGRIESAGSDTQLQLGLYQYLTVSSYDWNLDNQGQPRVNLQDTNADLSKSGLPNGAVEYLAAMRRANLQLTNPADLLEASGKFKNEKGKDVEMTSDIGKDDLAALLDRCTTTNQAKLIGLVNLNTASAKVLASLPGMNEALADSIVSARAGLSPEARQTPAWLYQEGIMNADAFKKVVPLLTTRSYQFHFFVAAYTIPAAAFRVIEVVVDAGVKPPRVLSLRDVSRLGLPFTPAVDQTQASVAQVSQPAVSPISQSAGRGNVQRVALAGTTQAWKPAKPQSALRHSLSPIGDFL